MKIITGKSVKLFCSLMLAVLTGTVLAHHSTRGIYEEEATEVTSAAVTA